MSNASPEAYFVDRLAKAIIRLGGARYNMHGNMFQSGIPDNLVVRPNGKGFTFFEAKHVSVKHPTHATMVNMLRPGQRKNLADWAHRYAADVYLVGSWAHDREVYFLMDRLDMPRVLTDTLPLPLEHFTLDEVANQVVFGAGLNPAA